MIIGIDLNDTGSRISFLEDGQSVPTTISLVTGGEEYDIPMLAAKRKDHDEWYFGKEALRLPDGEDVFKTDGLCYKAVYDDIVIAFGQEYKAFDLLVMYVKKLLSMTSFVESWQMADRICICAGELGGQSVKMLRRMARSFDYPDDRFDFISRSESFYEYMMHQQEDLWNHDVVLLDMTGKGILSRRLCVDRRTKPVVCRIYNDEDRSVDPSDDEALKEFAQKQTEGRIVTSVYLVGGIADKDTTPKTIRYLCMKRRVFHAHNLYTWGACHFSKDRHLGIDKRRSYLYLGKDKLRSNIGIRVSKVNEETYFSIVEAGVNWYDVNAVTELYLGRERELRFLISPMVGRNEHNAIMRLTDIPSRPEHTTRVRIRITMDTEDYLTVNVEDLGFGEIFPASGTVVTERIAVSI
ncbi:MAG: hypothetical protein IKR56_00715 [Lachnospiraceae bacterium]|nr:hypothetical protein [Lachnospiraceae bacterium]